MNNINIQIDHNNDFLLLKIAGRLDAITSVDVEKQLLNLLASTKSNKIIINFSNLKYLSSAGLRLLASIVRSLEVKNGKLVVCSASPTIEKVIGLAGFEEFLNYTKTETEAIQKINSF